MIGEVEVTVTPKKLGQTDFSITVLETAIL